MQRISLTVTHPVGLHARPAAQFVQTASQFQSKITVANLNGDGKAVDAKSILSILTLGVSQGTEIEITAEGPDEKDAIQALKTLVESNFGE